MSQPIEIHKATRKWFEEAMNEILSDYRTFFEGSDNIILTVMKETCCGERCITVEGAVEDASKSFRLTGVFDTTKEQSTSYLKNIAALIAESGRNVSLEGNQVFSNPTVSDLYSHFSIDLKARSVEDRWEVIYSPMDENDWKPFCSFAPTGDSPQAIEMTALTATRSLGLLLAALGKVVRTDCGTKFNSYGVVGLFPEIDQVEQVPQSTGEKADADF